MFCSIEMDINDQISLFTDLSGSFEIKKHSSFIQMYSNTSLMQRKIMDAIIYIVKDQLKRNPDQRLFATELGIIKKLAGIGRKDNKELKDALRLLTSLSIEYNVLGKDKEEHRGVFSFLASADIRVEKRGHRSIIVLELPYKVVEAIRKPRIYSQINILITRGLDSKHAYALYGVVKDYIKVGGIRIVIEDLRKIFGLTDTMYKDSFKMFQIRVLDKAVEMVNERSDIYISYDDPERIGRKVIAITFHGTMNNQFKTEHLETDELIMKLISLGFKEKRAKQIVKLHDKEYILANITAVEEQYMKKGKKVRSIPALLTSAFKTDFRLPSNEYTQQLKANAEKQNLESLHEKESKDLEDQLMTKFLKSKQDLVQERINALADSEIEEHRISFKSALGKQNIIYRFIQSKGFEFPAVQISRMKFMEPKLLSAQQRDFAVFKNQISSTEEVEHIEVDQ